MVFYGVFWHRKKRNACKSFDLQAFDVFWFSNPSGWQDLNLCCKTSVFQLFMWVWNFWFTVLFTFKERFNSCPKDKKLSRIINPQIFFNWFLFVLSFYKEQLIRTIDFRVNYWIESKYNIAAIKSSSRSTYVW